MSIVEAVRYAIAPEPLSPIAFAAYGDVAQRPIDTRRRYLPSSTDRSQDAATPVMWISAAARSGALPMQLTTLERHPFSAQTFVPLGAENYLAIVCGTAPDGSPDLATLRCFVAGAHQAVTFARNVWHHPMTVLGPAMEFVVAMNTTGRDDDDVFVSLDAEVHVILPTE